MGPCGEFEVHVGLSQDSASLTRIQLRALLKNFAIPAVRRAVVWTDVEALDPRRRSFEEALRAALGERDVEIRESRENGRPTLNPSAPAACAR
jgi:hypothetical protein